MAHGQTTPKRHSTTRITVAVLLLAFAAVPALCDAVATAAAAKPPSGGPVPSGEILREPPSEKTSLFGFSLWSGNQFPDEDHDIRLMRLNLFYGRNNSLTGLDMGLGINALEREFFGVQIAGVGNNVRDGTINVSGTGVQIAGLLNVTGRRRLASAMVQ